MVNPGSSKLVATVAIRVTIYILVRRSTFKTYTPWLFCLALSNVLALLFRIDYLVTDKLVAFPTKAILQEMNDYLLLLEPAVVIVSLVIMLRLFKDIADRYQSEHAFKQSAATAETGTWPPPPS